VSAQINGNIMPEPMASRGRYLWLPPEIIGTNGRGLAITAPFSTLTWQWNLLTLADYNWWITTVLAGAASLSCTTGTILVNHLQQRVAVSCVVMRPTYGRIISGAYEDVELQINRIEENGDVAGEGYWLGGGYPPTYSG
jgi:hypothetical protein